MKYIYVVVGFRTDSKKSVYYATAGDLINCLAKVRIAFLEKGAEFISLRRVESEKADTV